jgi:hypothetical protein
MIVGPKDTLPEVALRKTFDENTLNPLKIVSIFHKIVQLKNPTSPPTSSSSTTGSASTSSQTSSGSIKETK